MYGKTLQKYRKKHETVEKMSEGTPRPQKKNAKRKKKQKPN